MNKAYRYLVLSMLACAIVGVVFLKSRQPKTASRTETPAALPAAAVSREERTVAMVVPERKALPRLVDLGAGTCIPCRMMTPVLEELKKEYADTFDVSFVDVSENPEAARRYGVRIIPTQIFFDASGKELFRHEGFFSKEEILSTWQTQGVDLPEPADKK